MNRGSEPCIHLGKALGTGESTARSEMGEGLVCLRNKERGHWAGADQGSEGAVWRGGVTGEV